MVQGGALAFVTILTIAVAIISTVYYTRDGDTSFLVIMILSWSAFFLSACLPVLVVTLSSHAALSLHADALQSSKDTLNQQRHTFY